MGKEQAMRIVLVLGLVLAGLACDKTIEEAAVREGMSPMQVDRQRASDASTPVILVAERSAVN
jgi:hypothetical protein